MDYAKIRQRARTNNPGAGKSRRRKGSSRGGSTFKYDWRPSAAAEWVRIFPGLYARCTECHGHVDVEKDMTFKCVNPVWEEDQDEPTGTCGHTGSVEEPQCLPVCVNSNAYVPFGGRKKNGITVPCNCYNGELPEIGTRRPCALHDWVDDNSDSDVWPTNKFAHNVGRLSKFHLEEKTSSDGNRKWKQKELCEGRGCALCRDNMEVSWGKLEYFNPGSGYLQRLTQFSRVIRKKYDSCLSCDKGTVRTAGWSCSDCSSVLLDAYEDGCTETQLEDFGAEKRNCDSCGRKDFPSEIMECYESEDDDGNVSGGCKDPVGYSIFNCDIKISRANKNLSMDDFREPGPVEEKYAEIVDRPLDLQFLTVCLPSKQRQLMNISPPSKEEEQKPRSRERQRDSNSGGQDKANWS